MTTDDRDVDVPILGKFMLDYPQIQYQLGENRKRRDMAPIPDTMKEPLAPRKIRLGAF
jgi:hypothetical protein